MRPARALAPALLLVVASCGGSSLVSDDPPAATPYDGPLQLAISGDETAPIAQRAGAAARALECDHPPQTGGGGDYDGGLASTQDSAEDALQNSFDEDGRGATLPSTDYRVERRDDDRVLFSYDVDGRTRVSFIAYRGVKDFNRDTGWGIESWASCDPSELPASVTDGLNIGVWQDASGRRVLTDTVLSFDGSEHCAWQDITFVQLGPGPDDPEYVRDPAGKLAEQLTGPFDDSGELPPSALDTGFRRDGRELWLAADRSAAYLVDIADPRDVEVWPASRSQISCA